MQLGLGPGVTPAKTVLLRKVLVKVLHAPPLMAGPVLVSHPLNLFGRHPLGRSPAQPPVDQPGKPFLVISIAIASELPLRAPQ
jgi:hypothetical protein